MFEFFGPGADPVDAEQKIEDRACHRKEKTDGNPTESSTGVSLVQQGMAGSDNGHKRYEDEDNNPAEVTHGITPNSFY
jgi:hypothetical protein